MQVFSKETIDALARFESKASTANDAKLVTAALRSVFKQTLPGWVNGRYVGVVK